MQVNLTGKPQRGKGYKSFDFESRVIHNGITVTSWHHCYISLLLHFSLCVLSHITPVFHSAVNFVVATAVPNMQKIHRPTRQEIVRNPPLNQAKNTNFRKISQTMTVCVKTILTRNVMQNNADMCIILQKSSVLMLFGFRQKLTGRKIQSVDKFEIVVGCRPPGGNVRHENYMAALTNRIARRLLSAVADATARRSVDACL